MKKLSILFLFTISILSAIAQERQIPSIDLKNIKGEKFNTDSIKSDGPILISFWATWCKPCVQELIAVNENYSDWQTETKLKVYAISIDDSKSMARVAPFVNGKAWEFDVLLDPNSDFKNAMNVVNVPHASLSDKNGKIMWQHTSYSPGDEDELFEMIKKVAAGEEIKK